MRKMKTVGNKDAEETRNDVFHSAPSCDKAAIQNVRVAGRDEGIFSDWRGLAHAVFRTGPRHRI